MAKPKPGGRRPRKRQGAEVRYVAIPFPADTMSPYRESKAIDEILGCLTLPLKSPEQQTGYIETPKRPRIMTTGSFDEIQKYFHTHGLSDGLLSRVCLFRLGDYCVEGWLGLVGNVE